MFVRNRVLNYLLALLAAVAMPVYAQTLFDTNNATSVQQAVDAIKTTLEEQGRKIVATINHSGAAAGVGLSLRDTQLVIFSDPLADALSIARSRTFGIDLPNKLLVWQNAAGKIRVTSNPVSYLAERHRVRLLDPLLERTQRAQGQFDRDKGLVTVESSQSLDATVAAIRAAIQRAGLTRVRFICQQTLGIKALSCAQCLATKSNNNIATKTPAAPAASVAQTRLSRLM